MYLKINYLLILLLFIIYVNGSLNTNNKQIETIPLRVDGWIDKSSLINKKIINMMEIEFGPNPSNTSIIKGNIGLYIFNPLQMKFEERIESIQKQGASGAILREVYGLGGAFYFTNGKGTKNINLPTVEMSTMDFDSLVMSLNNSTPLIRNLTFVETNKYIEFDNDGVWWTFRSFYILWILILIIIILVIFYIFNVYRFNVSKENKFPTIILGLMLISLIIMFINGINLNDSNLLYHHTFTRITYTVHIPVFIIKHLMYGMWALNILLSIKQLKGTPSILGNMKIPFILLSILLIILEVTTIILTINKTIPIQMSYIVLSIYIFSCLGIIGLYLYTFPSLILKLNKNAKEHVKKLALILTICVIISLIGMFGWLIMLILQFPFVPLELAAKRYTGLFGFFGILISDSAVILSHILITKDKIKRNNTITKSTEKKINTNTSTNIKKSSTSLSNEINSLVISNNE